MNLALAIAAALLLAAVGGCKSGTAASAGAEKPEEKEAGRVTARLAPAERRTIAETVYGLGRCEALPRQIATLTPAVEGRVAAILVEQGTEVESGQPIVQLDPKIAQATLAEKEAARDGAQAALRLLESLPRAEEQAPKRLAVDQAEVAVAKAQSIVDRLRPLRARNEISAEQMFEAEQSLAQAKLQRQTAEAELTSFMLRPRPQAIDEAKTKVASAEAAVASAKAALDLLTLRAPVGGVLDSLHCRLGQTLAAGTAVGEVVDSRQVDVVVWLTVSEAQKVRPGQTARIRPGETASAEETPGQGLSGKVTLVGRVADPQTGNLPVRILVKNPEGRLVLGQIAGATITVAEKTDALAVPASAVYDVGEGPVVNVVREGKSAALHPALGVRDRQWVEIEGTDLRPGEKVVVEGGYNLPEGTEIEN